MGGGGGGVGGGGLACFECTTQIIPRPSWPLVGNLTITCYAKIVIIWL